MPGRNQFESIIASAPRVKLLAFERVFNNQLAVNGWEDAFFFAPAGTICEVLGVYFNVAVPAGAIAGSQELYLSFDVPTIDFVYASSTFAMGLRFNFNKFQLANNGYIPTTEEAVISAIRGITFDETVPLRMSYANYTDVVQANVRSYRLWTRQTTIS